MNKYNGRVEETKIVRALYTRPDEEMMDPPVQRTSGLSQKNSGGSRDNRQEPPCLISVLDDDDDEYTRGHIIQRARAPADTITHARPRIFLV